MALLDTQTLTVGTLVSGGLIYYGYNRAGDPSLGAFGSLSDSTSNIYAGANINKLYSVNFIHVLEIAGADNSGWDTMTIAGVVFNRTQASFSSGAWTWVNTQYPIGSTVGLNKTITWDSITTGSTPVISSISYTESSTNIVTTKVNLSFTGSTGTLEYAVSSDYIVNATPPISGWQTSNTFTQERGSNGTRTYWASRNRNTSLYSAPAFLSVSFLEPDSSITLTAPSLVVATATTHSVTIANGGSTTVYQVRVGSTAGAIVGSIIGNGTFTVSDVPLIGSTKTYYVTCILPFLNGGDPSSIIAIPNANYTLERDNNPTQFTFTDITGAALNTEYISNSVTLLNLKTPITITVENGFLSKNGAAFTTSPTQANTNDTIRVRGTSSSSFATAVNVKLIAGNIQDTFSITTTEGEIPQISDVTDDNSASPNVTTTVQLSSSGTGGTLQYAVSSTDTVPATGWQVSNVFSQPRGSTRYYWASRNTNISIFSTSFAKAVGYITPDSIINIITNSPISSGATTHTVTISEGASLTQYHSRFGSSSGTILASITGNGNLVVANVPAQNSSLNYYLTANVPPNSGGSGTHVNVDPLFYTIFKGTATDTTPDTFTLQFFGPINNASLNTPYTSSGIVIGGFDAPTPISITSTNGTGLFRTSNSIANYTSEPKTIFPGEYVNVRLTSPTNLSSTASATLTIGGVSNNFVINTGTSATPSLLLFRHDNADSPEVALSLYFFYSDGAGGTGLEYARVAGIGPITPASNLTWQSSNTFSHPRNTQYTYYGSRNRHTSLFTRLLVSASNIPNLPAPDRDITLSFSGLPIARDGTNFSWTVSNGNYRSEYAVAYSSDNIVVGRANGGTATNTVFTIPSPGTSLNLVVGARANGSTGGYSLIPGHNYVITREAEDTTPTQFNFTPVTGAYENTEYTSEEITISGLSTSVSVSITSTNSTGLFSKNSSAYSSASTTAINGDTFRLKLTSSPSSGATTSATLTVGGASDTWVITTEGSSSGDTDPNPISFTAVVNAPLSSQQTSEVAQVTLIDTVVPITIDSGEYSKNGSAFTSSPGTVSNGDSISLRHVSSTSYSTTVDSTVAIGGVTSTFFSTTLAAPSGPVNYGLEVYNSSGTKVIDTSSRFNNFKVRGVISYISGGGQSTTSHTISSSGSKIWILDAGLTSTFTSNPFVKIKFDATRYMLGQVSSWNSTTRALTVNIFSSLGSGTYGSWIITPYVSISVPGLDASDNWAVLLSDAYSRVATNGGSACIIETLQDNFRVYNTNSKDLTSAQDLTYWVLRV